MGTRSTYRVIEQSKDEKGKKYSKNYCLLYLQFDGYPTGHPLDTAKWLAKGKVVNGFGLLEEDALIFNGAGCLAAQLVARHKNGVGGTYLEPLSHRGNSWENYLYDIIVDAHKREITFVCYENGKRKRKLFEGSPAEFVKKYDKVPTDVNL